MHLQCHQKHVAELQHRIASCTIPTEFSHSATVLRQSSASDKGFEDTPFRANTAIDFPPYQELVDLGYYLQEGAVQTNLIHSSQILNAAVNSSCQVTSANEHKLISSTIDELLVSLGQVKKTDIQGQVDLAIYSLRVVSSSFFAKALDSIKNDPGVALVEFDDDATKLVFDWMHQNDKNLEDYLNAHGLGPNGFVFFSTLSAMLEENSGVIPDAVSLVLDFGLETMRNAGETPNLKELLNIFLNTPKEDFHSFLLEAARGLQGSFGGGAGEVRQRYKGTSLVYSAKGKAFRFQLDPDEQTQLTREVAAHNKKVGVLKQILMDSVLPYCEENRITVKVKPNVTLREQTVCPVLKPVTADAYHKANKSACPHSALDGESHSRKERIHPGYESVKQAYMPQVEMIYMVLTMISNALNTREV